MTWTAPRTWVAGETVTAALLNTHLRDNLLDAFPNTPDAWTTYTPTWTTAGTAPVLGNGTLTGGYMLIGKTVYTRGKLTFGTTTTPGTGSFFFSVPLARSANDFLDGAITGLTNGGSTNRFILSGQESTSTTFNFMAAGTPASAVSNTVPFTWTSTHYLSWRGLYESA